MLRLWQILVGRSTSQDGLPNGRGAPLDVMRGDGWGQPLRIDLSLFLRRLPTPYGRILATTSTTGKGVRKMEEQAIIKVSETLMAVDNALRKYRGEEDIKKILLDMRYVLGELFNAIR
jgi:hypothetical protein